MFFSCKLKFANSFNSLLLAKYFKFHQINKIKMSTNSQKSLVAICQMRSTNDKNENLKQINKIVAEAKEKYAQFVFIPECCDFVGENRKQTLELSEPLTGPTVKAYKNLASSNKIWLSLGGVHEAILNKDGEKTNKIYNAHVVINDCGEIVAVYRKLHLFDVDTPEFKFRESDVVDGGKNIVKPIDTPIGKIGLQICYDVRFVEASTILRKQGAEILTYPSAFAYSTGKAHWEVLLRARAIENQCYVIAAAQIGFHNKKRQSYGHALIADPWGRIIATCNEGKDVDVAIAEINLCVNEKTKQAMPCFDHRRNDMYNLICLREDLPTIDRKFAEHRIDKNTIFFESEHCFAFTNIRCVTPGHVLIATKRIAHRLNDLTNDEISDLFQSVVKVQKLIEPIYNATSSTTTCQDGPEAGQTVQHVHFHVMPRKSGDFDHNDLIYVELNKHDNSPDTSRRSLEDMITEAEMYRNKFAESRIIIKKSQNL